MKFSAYTQITKCTDAQDLKAGIAEIQSYFKAQEKAGKSVSNKSVIRLHRLQKMLELVNRKEISYWSSTAKKYVNVPSHFVANY